MRVRDYSVAAFGTTGAIAYLDAIEAAFRRMLNSSNMGAAHATLRPPTRSLRCQQHRILYELRGEKIRILRILHKSIECGPASLTRCRDDMYVSRPLPGEGCDDQHRSRAAQGDGLERDL
jgi:toxin ParE1/3/4